MSSLSTTIRLGLDFVFQQDAMGVVGQFKPEFSHSVTYANGTGANQSSMLYYDKTPASIAVAGTNNYDLTGSTNKDAFNTDLALTILKGLYIKNLATGAGEILEVGGGSNAVPLFADTSDIVQIQPGGCFFLDGPSAAGICSVTSGTADILRIVNKGSGTVTYDLAIWGA